MKSPAFSLLFTIALIPIVVFSQSNSPQSPVEIGGEPRHHPKFENEFVRIWDVTVPAGDATLWHVHRNDNVVVTLGGATLRIENMSSATVEGEWKFGDVRFSKATYVHRAMNIGTTQPDRLRLPVNDVRWQAGGLTHSIKNVGKTRFEAVDIELK